MAKEIIQRTFDGRSIIVGREGESVGPKTRARRKKKPKEEPGVGVTRRRPLRGDQGVFQSLPGSEPRPMDRALAEGRRQSGLEAMDKALDQAEKMGLHRRP